MLVAGGYTVGVLFLALGGALWKVKRAKKSTPWLLLLGALALLVTAFGGKLGGWVREGAGFLASTTNSIGVAVGVSLVLVAASVVMGVLMYDGIHPKSGKFRPNHNILALGSAVLWTATPGLIGSAAAGIGGLMAQVPVSAVFGG